MPRPHKFISDDEYYTCGDLHYQIVPDTSSGQRPTFAITGIIPPEKLDVTKVALYVTQLQQQQQQDGTADSGVSAVARYSLPLSDEDVNKVYDAGLPSSHGKGNETVYDPTYRQAHELKPPDFALSTDLIEASDVLNSLPTTIGLADQRLTVKLHKLNAYATGGFFKPHRDTPRGQDHIGTLTFCLPSQFTGGDLVIRQDAAEINVDWSRQVLDPATGVGSVGWCFLYSDCEHEVLPVESGLRVTLAYDVFYHREDPANYPAGEEKFVLGDSRANEMLAIFSRMFDPRTSLDYFPDGATLGFGLRHAYAGQDGWVKMEDLPTRLKGIDRALLSTLVRCGIDYEIVAVYEADQDEKEGYVDQQHRRHKKAGGKDGDLFVYVQEGDTKHGYNPELTAEIDEWSWYYYEGVLISRHPHLLEGASDVENTYRELIESGAQERPDIVWIAGPSVYENRNDYCAYGNEAMPTTSYTACAIVAKLPPAKDRKLPKALERFLDDDDDDDDDMEAVNTHEADAVMAETSV